MPLILGPYAVNNLLMCHFGDICDRLVVADRLLFDLTGVRADACCIGTGVSMSRQYAGDSSPGIIAVDLTNRRQGAQRVEQVLPKFGSGSVRSNPINRSRVTLGTVDILVEIRTRDAPQSN